MDEIRDDSISVQHLEVCGRLQNPFLMDDGTPVTTTALWDQRRVECYRSAVTLQYGTMPPDPEFLEVEWIDDAPLIRNYRITTGRKTCPVSFLMRVILPAEEGHFPAIVDGDLCWRYAFDRDYLDTVTDNGIAFVLFNRLELAPDRADAQENGPLRRCYPDRTFGALGAWAWGYSRCVDALEQLGLIDMDCIAFSGHSRGGKTALLAGVLDSRAAIVNTNGSGAGGAGCYRVNMTAYEENGALCRSETLGDLLGAFPHWFGPDLFAYIGKEDTLPFDEHFLKALVAPRVLLETEAVSDIWANPIGSWQTAIAAREVYRFLGAEENILLSFRTGYHQHDVRDLQKLVEVIQSIKNTGKPLLADSFRLPFPAPERIFDWRCPE